MQKQLVILGNPYPTPRPNATCRKGKAWLYNSHEHKNKQAWLAGEIRKAYGEISEQDILTARPLRVDVELFFDIGTSNKEENDWYIYKPDRDNLDKFILDGLSQTFLADDCLVCDGRIQKKYSKTPRTVITITTLDD